MYGAVFPTASSSRNGGGNWNGSSGNYPDNLLAKYFVFCCSDYRLCRSRGLRFKRRNVTLEDKMVPLDWWLRLPAGHLDLLKDLQVKKRDTVLAGVVDPDSEWKVVSTR